MESRIGIAVRKMSETDLVIEANHLEDIKKELSMRGNINYDDIQARSIEVHKELAERGYYSRQSRVQHQ